jgi:hypothetical protein
VKKSPTNHRTVAKSALSGEIISQFAYPCQGSY